ncbi:MAG: NnrS family protein [Pseudomonadota bacterium]
MQVTNQQREMAITPILRQAYRPLFLLGAAFSAVAILLWGLALLGMVSLPVYGNILFWHSHEMLYGFVVAIVLGFLLTAVQNWTGLRAPHGPTLLILVLLWGAGRLIMLFGQGLPWWLVMAVDVSVLPVAAMLFARLVLKASQKRNLFFIPILLLLAVTSALMHVGYAFNQYEWQVLGAYTGVFLVTLLMVIIGGRVMPMFTANGTMTKKIAPILWLDRLAIGSVWTLFIIHFFNLTLYLPDLWLGCVFAVAAVANAVRAARWKFWLTWRVPLLWSLHIGYWFIPLGFGLLAAHYWGAELTRSTAMHALTAGAMGNMILAMMARVALGHSGRSLKPKPIMSVAFLLMIAAALLRVVFVYLWPELTTDWLLWSSMSWSLALIIFVLVYFKIFVNPRTDGNPG